MHPQEESPLEELQESLYNPNVPLRSQKRRIIHGQNYDVPEAWSSNAESEQMTEVEMKKKSTLPYGILLVSLCIFIGAILFAWYKLGATNDIFSPNNTYLTAEAPEYVDGGEIFDFSVDIVNENAEGLELVAIEVSYQQGSESNVDRVIRVERLLSGVDKNTRTQEVFPLTLYGIPESAKKINAKLSYNVPSSSATFEKEISKTVIIKSSPLTLTMESVDAVTEGQEIEVKLRIEAVKGKSIPDVTVRATYPTGFQYVDADIKPSIGTNTWMLGTMKAGDVREIKIRGIARGENKEVRALTVAVGALDSVTNDFAYQYLSQKKEYTITKPFLETRIVINGRDARTHAASTGGDIDVDIIWKNNLNVTVQNAEISLLIAGAFVENTIRADTGLYDSQKDTVTWTKSKELGLGTVKPGASGNVSVRFRAQDAQTLNTQESIILTASAKGRRVGESNVSELLTTTDVAEIKLATRLVLLGDVRRIPDSFASGLIGSVPPRAETETSYVIESVVQNTVNPVDQAVMQFTLPQGVRYIESRAEQGSVSYSESNKEVIWTIGTIAKSGTNNDPQLYVHVGVTPSITDIGQAMILMQNMRLVAIDTFTKSRLQIMGPNVLTTKFSTKDGFKNKDEAVVR